MYIAIKTRKFRCDLIDSNHNGENGGGGGGGDLQWVFSYCQSHHCGAFDPIACIHQLQWVSFSHSHQ